MSASATPLDVPIRVTGDEQARESVRRLDAAIADSSKRTQQSNQEAQRSSQASAQSLQQLSASAISMGARMAGVMSAVSALSNAMGNRGVGGAAGLAAQALQSSVQMAALGATFGPHGALVGGIVGAAIPAISSFVESMHSTSAATTTFESDAARIESSANRIAAAYDRANMSVHDFVESMSNDAINTRQRAAGETITQNTDSLVLLQDQLRVTEERINQLSASRVGIRSDASNLDRLQAISAEIEQLEGSRTAFAAAIADYAAQNEALQQVINDDESLRSGTGTPPPTRPPRGGGGRRAAGGSGGNENPDAHLFDLIGSYGQQDSLMSGLTGAQELADRLLAIDEAKKSALLDREREHQQAIIDLRREQQTALEDADKSYQDRNERSISAIIENFKRLQNAQRTAGASIISTSRLMERSLRATADSIGDSIGNKMTSAFETSLGAWLDGSKSFVEAAEGMAKGVIKALTMEAIVQAVVETARGVASIASYDFPGAAAHFGAAAAWGVVGGVAGGIGAATGAFGGAGAKGGAKDTIDSRDMAAKNTSQSQGNTILMNVYPGGYITARDVQAGIIDALNVAARQGMRVDGRLVGT